jgi:hypothetical protein
MTGEQLRRKEDNCALKRERSRRVRVFEVQTRRPQKGAPEDAHPVI